MFNQKTVNLFESCLIQTMFLRPLSALSDYLIFAFLSNYAFCIIFVFHNFGNITKPETKEFNNLFVDFINLQPDFIFTVAFRGRF